MTILYLHQYFKTRSMDGGTRSFEIARRLVARGHVVHMITSDTSGRPTRLWTRTLEDGIDVHWLSNRYHNRMPHWRRVASFVRFALFSSIKARSIKADIVFATSTPLTIAIPALFASVGSRVPMVFEVRDLWPEVPIGMGVLRNRLVVAAAKWLQRRAYAGARHIVALSPAMREAIVHENVHPSRVSVIPNSCDLDLFRPLPATDARELRKRHGLHDRFVCIHAGAMGIVNGLDYILDAAKLLAPHARTQVVFLLHGDGRERARLEARCRTEGIENVLFSGPTTKEETASLVACCDAAVMTVADIPVLHACSPNKLFDALAAGKPVLSNVRGWLRDVLEQNRAGFFVDPARAEDLAQRVTELARNADLVSQLGLNARRLAERQFDRDKMTAKIEAILEHASCVKSP